MGHTHTKRMVQGAMIAALFGVLSLLNTYTGSFFDIFICYGMVIPLTWYGYTYTIKDNIVVCICSIIVIAMVGLPFFVISSISSCFAGLFIGEALKRHAKKEVILFGTFVVTMLNNILIYEVLAGFLEVDLVEEMTMIYEQMSMLVPSLSLDMILSLIPMILVMTSIMEMYVIVMLCQIALSRFKIEFPGSFHLATMHLSEKTGIVVVVMLFGSYVLTRVFGIDHIVLKYMFIFGDLILRIQGLSFICLYSIFKQRRALVFLGFIGFIVPLISTLYVVIGILDIFSDLRGNLLYNRHNE